MVAVFDSRVVTKAYGRQFLDSLPDCTKRQGTRADLPEMARRWIDEKKL